MSFKKSTPVYTIPFLALLSACSVFGHRSVEEPKYEVLASFEDYEVRQYNPMILAKTTVTGEDYDKAQSTAFRRLAGYIFGKNQKKTEISMTAPVATQEKNESTEIAMTAPVGQQMDGQQYTMTFMMPSQYTLDTLPKPEDDRIEFITRPAQKMAVTSFTWLASEERYQEYETKLREDLASNPRYKAKGEAVYAGYNPPWTIPFLRTNEVLIEVMEQ